MSLRPATRSPRRSIRARISPARLRCIASGLINTSVRSTRDPLSRTELFRAFVSEAFQPRRGTNLPEQAVGARSPALANTEAPAHPRRRYRLSLALTRRDGRSRRCDGAERQQSSLLYSGEQLLEKALA